MEVNHARDYNQYATLFGGVISDIDALKSQIDVMQSEAQTNANNIAQRARFQYVKWGTSLTSNLIHGILILNFDAVYVFWYAGVAPNMDITFRRIYGNDINGITFTVLNKSGQGDLWKVNLPSSYAITAIGR